MTVCIAPTALRWQVCLSRQADDYLDALEERYALQVLTAIGALACAENPLLDPNVRVLEVYDRAYRLRVGKYRIVFRLCGRELRIDEIDNRRDAYGEH